MREKPLLTAELYKVVRKKRPAVRMMQTTVAVVGILVGWSAITPINESVIHVAKIVPMHGAESSADDSITPNSVISGTVSNVFVIENQFVKKGEILVQLDASEFEIQLKIEQSRADSFRKEIVAKSDRDLLENEKSLTEERELQAQLSNEKREIERLRKEREIKIAKATDERDRLQREFVRFSKLRRQGAVSQSEVDVLETELKGAIREVESVSLPVRASKAFEIQSRIDANVVTRKEAAHVISTEIEALKSKLAVALHEIELWQVKIERCQIRANASGLVSRNNVRKGDYVTPGLLDIALAPDGLMAEAFMPSRLISDVKVGDTASIMFDGVDWLTNGSLPATVVEISPDLVREEVAQGDGSSVLTDGFRVYLELNEEAMQSKWNRIRLGMTGAVEIRTGQQQLATYLLENALGTDWLRPKK